MCALVGLTFLSIKYFHAVETGALLTLKIPLKVLFSVMNVNYYSW